MHKRLYAVEGMLLVGVGLLTLYLALLMQSAGFLETAVHQSQTVLTAGYAQGTIYDRHLRPLTNAETRHYAAAIPTPAAVSAILPHVQEITPLHMGLRTGKPFLCEIDTDVIDCPGVQVLSVPGDAPGHLPGQHLLGYTLENVGVTGLQNDFDALLRRTPAPVQITYTVDARGHALNGIPGVVSDAQSPNGSIVTTLDADIQTLCEAQPLDKGAIVVMDVQTGDILAMASFPAYDPDRLGEALSDENAPLINRCLCPYNVGSIFKLVTSAAAYEQHRTHFVTECTGKTEISGQVFRCHDWRGHGVVDLTQAMIDSCNAYFVELSTRLDPVEMRTTAQNFGFGTQIVLSKSILSQSGTLPSAEDLQLPAEMANFCFGQGKLTATPLQVTQMTCGIANDGKMPIARLVLGETDGSTLPVSPTPRFARPIDRREAAFLQALMIAAVNQNPHSKAVPETVFAAAKTSTAQTGRFDASGTELCHGWITGYFPIDKPRYAVTVLAEDGGYGNDAAAPIFAALADGIMQCRPD